MVVNMSDTNYVVAESLRDDLYRNDNVLLLDCRTNEEYRLGNISGSYNIVLPQIMMRRLKANKLSLKSLVPPNFRQEKEAFLKKCLSYQVVLYDQLTTELNNNDQTLLGLLYNRMREEGCSVFVLKGGFSKFGESYPELCVKAESATSSDADDEECGCGTGPKCLREGRCSPTSPLTQLGPTILGLGALTISCENPEPDNAAFHLPPINSNVMTPHEPHNVRRDNMNSEGESDYPNSATSESSSEIDRSHTKPSCISIPPVTTNSSKSPPDNHSFQAGRNNQTGPIEILPGLFLGCAKDASSRETLSQFNITYILNVTPNLPNVFEGDMKFTYKQIAITDHWSQNLSQFFPAAISFIDEARSKKCGILVHCLAGISRSVTVTVAYLMQKYRWSLNDAYDFVKQRKNNVSPNFNFMGQLLDFEKTLGVGDFSSCGEACVSSGASSISSPPTLFFTSPPPPTPKLTLPVRKKSDANLKQRSALIMTNTAS